MNVLLAMPAYKGVEPRAMASALELQAALLRIGASMTWAFPRVPFIDLSRDMLASVFLKSPGTKEAGRPTHMLMVDDDIGYSPSVVSRLIEKVNAGAALAVALPPLREVHLDWVLEAAKREKREPERYAHRFAVQLLDEDRERRAITLTDGWGKVKSTGLAMAMITRECLERLDPHCPDYATEDGLELTGYFTAVLDSVKFKERRQLRRFEDGIFCARWREACKGEIWVDATARLTHSGPMTFEGSWGDTVT